MLKKQILTLLDARVSAYATFDVTQSNMADGDDTKTLEAATSESIESEADEVLKRDLYTDLNRLVLYRGPRRGLIRIGRGKSLHTPPYFER